MSTGLLIAFVLFALALAQAMLLEDWRDAMAKAAPPPALGDADLPGITAIVPARDEEERIARVLQDLYAQRYPKEKLEVIVVDDASTDRTAAIAEGMRRTWPQLRVLPSRGAGKKAALTTGVEAAAHGLIVLTDADARFGPERLRTIAAGARAQAADLLVLPVATEGHGLLGRLQQAEQAGLLGMVMGSALAGRPTLAYGANLAFGREAFHAAGGYANDRFASGDDLFLLRRMRARGMHIGAVMHPDATAATDAAGSWSAFLQQRLRWAGKMRGAPGATALLGAAGLLWPWALLAFTLRFSLAGAMGHQAFQQLLLIAAAWVLWLSSAAGLTCDAQRRVGQRSSRLAAALALAAFMAYAPAVAVLSWVVRPAWKGRRV